MWETVFQEQYALFLKDRSIALELARSVRWALLRAKRCKDLGNVSVIEGDLALPEEGSEIVAHETMVSLGTWQICTCNSAERTVCNVPPCWKRDDNLVFGRLVGLGRNSGRKARGGRPRGLW